ncbi:MULTISPECIES: histidine phosphatase family protein [Bacillus cereus group]|uniref:Histidine phosphatase family protein n=1 Tax=Bacillus cereus TaxID=1396 RepID=A0AA44Q987_BACCE|nr:MULTISPECIES: histidine phosphatase family protein [Bacillus cereus group]PFN10110.1 histidine phosphatase family protein [Bacillus cereus]PFO84547.1 histidine phosphatase family protein [Bacillus cereus]PFR99190.1 histidine phosphatase family protein [Bacillus cereus]PGZ17314.1 histidine phosphatase family protein [Bacillus cereus]
MRISFIRHGRLHTVTELMTASSFHKWMERYDLEGIEKSKDIPIETIEAIESAKLIVSSDQKRAVQSAAEVMNSLSFIQNSLFREAEIPSKFFVPEWVKCKPEVWTLIGRTLWMIGYSKGVESYREAQGRAKQATDTLVGYALVHGHIALVGHSYFNMMIGAELRARGWSGPPIFHRKPWSCTEYTFHEAMNGNILNTNLT